MTDTGPRVLAPRSSTSRTQPIARFRPATLDEFVGQHQLRDNLRVFIEAAKTRGERSTISCSSVLPGLARRRSHRSSRAKWASTSMRRQAR